MIERISGKDISFGPVDPAEYCRLPYPKHPDGCPNVNKSRSLAGIPANLKPWIIRECPKSDPKENIFIDQVFDLTKPLHLIITSYPVGEDAEYRRTHSQILKTVGQFYNLRYWQDRARRKIYDECEKFLLQDTTAETRGRFTQMSKDEIKNHTIVDLCPEAHGVKIIPTVYKTGLKIKFGVWPPPEHDPKIVRYRVAIGGYPANVNFLMERGSIGRSE